MNKEDMKKYKGVTEVTPDECYMGTRNCASCAHAFPGHYAVDHMKTDVTPDTPSVCLLCKKRINK